MNHKKKEGQLQHSSKYPFQFELVRWFYHQNLLILKLPWQVNKKNHNQIFFPVFRFGSTSGIYKNNKSYHVHKTETIN